MENVVDELVIRIRGDTSDFAAAIGSVRADIAQLDRQQRSGRGSPLAQNSTRDWQATGKSIKEVGQGIDDITKPVQYASVAVLGLGSASAMAAINFEDNFASVKKTVEGTPEQLEKIKQEIIDMSTVGINGHSAIPLTTAELTELAAAGGQLGIETENISDFTETMAMLGTATNLYGEQGAQTLARFMNVTNTAQDEIANLGSAIVDLGNNFATTEAEIADMALNMGATGSVVGISAQDVLAYSTALSSLGVEAAAGGSAVSRIWMEIQSAVSSGGKSLQKFAKLSGMSAKEFKNQWQTDASGAFQKFLKGLSNDSDQISTLSDLGFNNIRDIQALQRLAGEKGFNLLTDAIERSNTAWSENTALLTEFEAKADTTASKIQIVKNNATEAARSFGEVMLPSIVDITGGLASMAQGLASTDEGTKKMLVNTGIAIVGLGAGAKVTSGAIKTVGNVVEGVGKIKASKTFQSIASGIAAIPGPAKLAVAGVAAVGVAVYAGYKAYQQYQYEQLHFADKVEASTEALKKQKSAMDEVNDFTWEFKDLQLRLKSDDISEAEKNKIVERMKEIAEWFKKNYNVVLKVESSSVEDAAENVEKLDRNLHTVTVRTELEESKLLQDIMAAKVSFDKAISGEEVFGSEKWDIAQAEKWRAEADKYMSAQLEAREMLAEIEKLENDPSLDPRELDRKYDEYADKMNAVVDKYSLDMYHIGSADSLVVKTILSQMASKATGALNQATIHSSQAEATRAEIEGYYESVRTYIEQQISGIGDAVQSGEEYSERLHRIGYAAEAAGIPIGDIAAKTALAQNGFESFFEAAEAGDEAFNNTINNAVQNMRAWGASSNEIAMQTALMRKGFTDLQGAVDAGALDVVSEQYIQDAQKMGVSTSDIVKQAALLKLGFSEVGQVVNTGKLPELAEQATKIARSMDLIPDDKNIVINANGDMSVLEDVQAAVDKINEAENIQVEVSATGDVSVVETTDEKLQELINNSQVTITFNAETNGFDISDLQGNKLGQITADGTVNWQNGEQDEPEDKPAKVNYKLGDQEDPEERTAYVNYVAKGGAIPNARGTQNFAGGLAMVNDDGRADPRELIIDRGRAFIPEGKNVILPLSRGAKVYTSEQTKAIMSGIGIPHYASGKDNSKAFTTARDNWQHYTKTHTVTTAQELEKWLEFQEKYKKNQKDIWDIEEQVFALRQKHYSEQTKASEQWLSHETKYNGLVYSEQLDAIDRIRQNTVAAYEAGLISHKEYLDTIASYDEKYIDTRKEHIEEMFDISKAYISEHTYFNDWRDNGDDPLDAYNRVKQDRLNELRAGELTQKEYDEYMSSLGSDMFSERIEQSRNWLDEQRKYFSMSDAEYVEGLERMKRYTQEYYDNGLISRREYNEAMTELDHSMWDEALSAYDDMLQKQQDYISDMREQFQKEEQALQDSWKVEDRKVDMSEVSAQLDIYAGAVTDRGQQKYKELQEQMKQLQHEEELYQLQVRNNATIEGLEADYKILEEDKKNILNDLRAAEIDVSGYVERLSQNISTSNIEGLLGQLLTAFNNFKIDAPSTTYADNRVVNLSGMSLSEFAEYMGDMGGMR